MIARFRLPRLTADRLSERAIEPEAVLQAAGLPTNLFAQEKILLTTEQLFTFWAAVGKVSRDPAVGLSLGSEDRVERFDVVSMAALSAPSLREAMARVARYKQISCPEEIQIVRRGQECAVRFRWVLARTHVPGVLVDFCFAWIATLARRGTSGVVKPARIEYSRAGHDRRAYTGHFACPIAFDAQADAVIFSAADFDHPFSTRNTDLLSMLAPQLEAELADRRADGNARDEVKGVLRRLLAGGRPELGDVARSLAASPRTLQRRLSELGVSYQQVLEEARRELATHYLRHSTLELTEIAYLVGYADANSFFRAFSRWEGVSPGAWRGRQRRSMRGTKARLAS